MAKKQVTPEDVRKELAVHMTTDNRILYDIWGRINIACFDGNLTPPIITWQRKPNMTGAYTPPKIGWDKGNGEDQRGQISLNPDAFTTPAQLKALVMEIAHNMCHQFQEMGNPYQDLDKSYRHYHDKVFADIAATVGMSTEGLDQSNKPTGKGFGNRVTHTCREDGPLWSVLDDLYRDGVHLTYYSRPDVDRSKPRTTGRSSYTCDHCGTKVWGKPDLPSLACCGVPMTETTFDGRVVAKPAAEPVALAA